MTDLEKKDLGKHERKGKRKTMGSDDETQSQPDSPEYDNDDNNDEVTQTAPAKKGETIIKLF
jgi:hypothetical protein